MPLLLLLLLAGGAAALVIAQQKKETHPALPPPPTPRAPRAPRGTPATPPRADALPSDWKNLPPELQQQIQTVMGAGGADAPGYLRMLASFIEANFPKASETAKWLRQKAQDAEARGGGSPMPDTSATSPGIPKPPWETA